jgi:hypothetical protein
LIFSISASTRARTSFVFSVRDYIVFVIAPGLAEPGQIADRHLGDVFHQHRYSARLGSEHDVLDVFDFLYQAEAANVDRLLTDVDRSPSDVFIGVAEGREQLLQRDVVGVELVQIRFDVVALGRAAPGHHLDHARNRQ